MPRPFARIGVSLLLGSVILAACGQTSADEPSMPPSAPAEQPSESPSERPSEQPVATPRPSRPASPAETPTEQPTVAPTPTPFVLVEHDLPMIGRVTADGVAVRTLPEVDAPIVNGNNPNDEVVDVVRLRAGDEVIVMVGPVMADGYSWYEVVAGARGPAQYFRGWMAGEFLERAGDAELFEPSLEVDGQGFDASGSAWFDAHSPLVVQHGVTPMAGKDSCTFAMSLVDTAGNRIELHPRQVVTGPMVGELAAGNWDALYVTTEGHVTLDVVSDCSFAVAVRGING